MTRAPDANLDVRIHKRFASGLHLEVGHSFPPGITILFGASGAGKTTLLDCIAGLTEPDSGRIALGNDAFFQDNPSTNISPQKRHIGYVFQDLALFPHLTVEQNVIYGIRYLPHAEQQLACNRMLESFRIAHLRDRKIAGLSGGEGQRVALARALITNPCALLLDEPLVALDASLKSKLIDDLRARIEARPIPVIYVTHSREEVFALGERMLLMDNGKITAEGTPHEVMSAPRQLSAAQLTGFENVFDVTVSTLNEDRGTMTCDLAPGLELETPLLRASVGTKLRVGIRAGDILLATVAPQGLSARNILPGKIVSLERRDVIVAARVDCGVEIEVHMTLAARDSLALQPGRLVWLIIKTHSCHLME